MNALELNEMNITIAVAEMVTGNTAVCIDADELLPVTIANILDADFSNDDEAEFLQGVLKVEKMIEDIILSDNPEEFLLPTDDDLPPVLKLLEYIDALKDYKFAGRTLDRMDRRIRGTNLVVEEKLTQLQKSEHPDYKDWSCPDCLNYFKGARALRHHRDREICRDRHTRLVVKATKEQVVTPVFFHTTAAMSDLVARSFMYKKNIDPELVEETIEEEVSVANVSVEEDEEIIGNCVKCEFEGRFIGKQGDEWTCINCLENDDEEVSVEPVFEYIVKTWIYDAPSTNIEYFGLYEGADWVKCWTDKEDAMIAFESAIETGEFVAVELIQINPDATEDRETIIDEWEDTLSDYVPDEVEIDYIEPNLVEAKANLKKVDTDDELEETPKRSIRINYSNGKVEWEFDENGNVEWDFDDRDVVKKYTDAVEWGKTQVGLESICLVEFYSDGSMVTLSEKKYEN